MASQSFFLTVTWFCRAIWSMIKNPKLCRVRSCFLPGFPRPTTSFTNRFLNILRRELLRTPRHLPFALPEPLARLQLPPLLPRSESEPLQPTAVPPSPRQNSFQRWRLHPRASAVLRCELHLQYRAH